MLTLDRTFPPQITAMDEEALLREYARSRSEVAFRELVARHVDLVHSAAVRQVRQRELAEDVTQTVFLLLARKAPEFRDRLDGGGFVLAAWLYETTRLTARNALKVQARRRHHERKAAMVAAASTRGEFNRRSAHSAWADMEPVLDEGLSRLSDRDRAAIVIRYFEQRSLADTGAALGVSADAAQMRVTRALDKLKAFLTSRKGRAAETAVLASAMRGFAVQAAPAPALAKAVEAGLPGAELPSIDLEIARAVEEAWRTTWWRKATLISVATVVLVAGSVFLLQAGLSSQAAHHHPGKPVPADRR